MNTRHAAALALVGWALLVPPFIKTCPESGPCTYPPVVGRGVVKEIFPTKDDCDQAAAAWKVDLDLRLKHQHERQIGPERAVCVDETKTSSMWKFSQPSPN